MQNQDFNVLAKYEEQLQHAQHDNYITLTSAEFDELAATYERMYLRRVTTNERWCGSCRLRIAKQLALAYFATKNEREQAEAIKTTTKPKKARKTAKNG